MGIIILTSTGLSSQNVYNEFKKITDSLNFKKAVIITTAASDKENNQYSQLALSQLKSIGFDEIVFYDFENDSRKDLSTYDVIYVCGGNTFKLMKFAKDFNFDKEIKLLLKRGGAYIGVSAGSLIIGPSIKIAEEINPDLNEIGLIDLDGFGITDVIIFPHYAPEFEKDIKLFEDKNDVRVERIKNSQAIVINDNERILIG